MILFFTAQIDCVVTIFLCTGKQLTLFFACKREGGPAKRSPVKSTGKADITANALAGYILTRPLRYTADGSPSLTQVLKRVGKKAAKPSFWLDKKRVDHRSEVRVSQLEKRTLPLMHWRPTHPTDAALGHPL